MTNPEINSTHPQKAAVESALSWDDRRIAGLSRFAVAITALNILGHFYLGFEQSWATPLVSLAAAYATEVALEWLASRDEGRAPRYAGGAKALVQFMLSAHVSGLAVGMLLMPLEQLWVVAFAASLAIASKRLFRVKVGQRSRHFLNPSNFGITIALLAFPSVGIAPPYQFTEATSGIVDVLLPLAVICTGSLLNTKLTGRMPLLSAWATAFAVQAVLRATWHDTSMVAGLVPMTGFAFILFTFYMVTDPATTPSRPRNQLFFGTAVAVIYAVFMELHVVFGMFYALTLVTLARGFWLGVVEPVLRTQTTPVLTRLEPGE